MQGQRFVNKAIKNDNHDGRCHRPKAAQHKVAEAYKIYEVAMVVEYPAVPAKGWKRSHERSNHETRENYPFLITSFFRGVERGRMTYCPISISWQCDQEINTDSKKHKDSWCHPNANIVVMRSSSNDLIRKGVESQSRLLSFSNFSYPVSEEWNRESTTYEIDNRYGYDIVICRRLSYRFFV